MYTVYTQLPPERNAIYRNHLIKLLLWKLWLCWDDPKQKPFFNAVNPLSKPQCNPLILKTVLNCRMCRRKKEKKIVILQALWKFSIDWILMKMSVLNTTWQMFFPGFILGQTRNQLLFQTASFMVEEGPRRHKPANYFQHSNLHLPETLHTRTEHGRPTFTLTNTSPLLRWTGPVYTPGSCQLVSLLSFYFLQSPHCT